MNVTLLERPLIRRHERVLLTVADVLLLLRGLELGETLLRVGCTALRVPGLTTTLLDQPLRLRVRPGLRLHRIVGGSELRVEPLRLLGRDLLLNLHILVVSHFVPSYACLASTASAAARHAACVAPATSNVWFATRKP